MNNAILRCACIAPIPLAILSLLVITTGCSRRSPDRTVQLRTELEGVTKVRIRSGGTCHRDETNEKTLLEISDPAAIKSFVDQIQIDSKASGFHCMCCGEPTVEFYKQGLLLTSLGFHHGQSLRWAKGKWKGDGLLMPKSAEAIVRWLEQHGVHGPAEERKETARLEEQARISSSNWVAAMPSSLKPFWPQLDPMPSQRDLEKLNKALSAEYPDRARRIMALLSWFGSGEGPWSGHPSYEMIAEEILLLYSTAHILSAIEGKTLTEQQTEGLARLLGGWDFSEQRPNDLTLITPELAELLLKHSLKSADEDKRGRAQRAFAKKQSE